MIPRAIVFVFAIALPASFARGADSQGDGGEFPLKRGETIAFFGDSITQAGGYIVALDMWLREQEPDLGVRLINLGLSSETVTGLTEPDHPFPRPNVHERIDRAISRVPFDTAVLCYGMNDGIYHPFSDARFTTYQIGMLALIEKLNFAGKRVVVMTPPPFDAASVADGALADATAAEFGYKAPYRNYDAEVLARYADWVLALPDRVALRIDLRTPVLAAIAAMRADNPAYRSGDGVHPDAAGHAAIARAILAACGVENPILPDDAKLREHVTAIHKILDEAYRVHVGHQRPGERDEVPTLEEALTKVAAMEAEYHAAGARQ